MAGFLKKITVAMMFVTAFLVCSSTGLAAELQEDVNSIYLDDFDTQEYESNVPLRIEVDGMVFSSPNYFANTHYYEIYQEEDNYIVEICRKSDDVVVETITILPEEPVGMARGSGYVQRVFKHTTEAKVGDLVVCAIENEVVLYIYAYNSFKQIESVLSTRVYKADGFSIFSLDPQDTTATVASYTGGFPTHTVNCYYSATCIGTITVGVSAGPGLEIGIDEMLSFGFEAELSAETEIEFTKNLSGYWSVSYN